MNANEACVRQLGYLVFECTPDVLEAMTSVYRDVLEAGVAQVPDGIHVRFDGRGFRIRLEAGSTNRLSAIGWEVASGGIDELAEKIASAGGRLTVASASQAEARLARRVMSLTDADGFTHEFYVEQDYADDPELDARFVCGEEDNGTFGLGHIVQIVGDREATQNFYIDVLGFALSDQITWPAADLYFLHCNQRHHTVALSAPALGMPAGAVHHLMIEAKSKAQVDRAYARLGELGFPVVMTIGQHTNDEVYSFYMGTPAGFAIEFGYGGKVVDRQNWAFAHYDAPSSWGHELQLAPQS